MTPVRVRDLPDCFNLGAVPRPILYCTNCGAQYSAHAGDYWNLSPDHAFYCECNHKPMILATLESVVREWTAVREGGAA
jgi:hypothetical protein